VPPAIKLWLLYPSHWATPTVSLKPVFAKLLWKLFLNPRSLLKLMFHGGISSATLLLKRKSMPSTEWKTWFLSDIIIFKRCRVILEAKSSSWQQFCTSRKEVCFIQQLSKLSPAFCQRGPTNQNATVAKWEMSHTTPNWSRSKSSFFH